MGQPHILWGTENFEYPKNQFFDFVTAQITGGSAKVLADPTLIVQKASRQVLGSDVPIQLS